MNIGDTVKLIKKEYPSVSISRIRFLEKEGLIKPKKFLYYINYYSNINLSHEKFHIDTACV